MSATRMIVRFAIAIAALLSLVACNDDERKAREKKYDVTIYVSDHIVGDIINVKPERKFTKPRVEIHAPEGVIVVPIETKPRKTTVIEFAPVALTIMTLLSLLLIARLLFCRATSLYSFFSTYQRG